MFKKKKNKKPNLIVKEGLEKDDSEMNERYAKREDTGNIFGIGITDCEFVSYIKDIILGPDWYTVAPLGKNQVNEEILESIISVLMAYDDVKRNFGIREK